MRSVGADDIGGWQYVLVLAWRVGLGVLGTIALYGCGGDSGPSASDRCRELKPRITAEAAWDDIYKVQEDTEEWLRLDCESLLGDET